MKAKFWHVGNLILSGHTNTLVEEDDVKIKDYIGAIGKAPYQMTFYRDWQDYPLFDRKLPPRWSSLLCGRRPAEG